MHMKWLSWLIAVTLGVPLIFIYPVQAASAQSATVKELNFVFLHGAAGERCSLQRLSDSMKKQLPSYIADYQQTHPGVEIRVNSLDRCYPAYVGVDAWARNIADSINEYFPGKENLILIGHSMGGKSALYAAAKNISGLGDKVAMVVTINSPIKKFNDYVVFGGGSVEQYCRAGWFRSDEGICDSVTNYDSSGDGSWIGHNRHWLSLISGESAPLSQQFDTGNVDPWPRDMDDGLVPVSAQYADGADVIYYGEHDHWELTDSEEVAGSLADKILRYIFGGSIEYSVFNRGGTFDHRANWLPLTDYWDDAIGEVPSTSGSLEHTNQSFTDWQEWEDVVGQFSPVGQRSSFQVTRRSLPLLTGVLESRWLNPVAPGDGRVYIRTRAAPRTKVRVDWGVYQRALLSAGIKRDRYEVEIWAGTPLTRIEQVSWLTNDINDVMLRVRSAAESPFRWFRARWRVYSLESRRRQVIDEIPAKVVTVVAQGG